ncbi:MAG: Crp/Fnr family transcriptional regulator [Gammaproteobacteria bacterium]|nr:Crp/Fnr family transcriptional regulator [Gammaproteobacteria bacterium]
MSETALHHELSRLNFLADDDFEMLDELLSRRHTLAAGDLMVMDGDPMEQTTVVLDGWAFRFKDFPDGRRQIFNFLLPGDIVGMFALMFGNARCGVEALTALEVAAFPSARLVPVFQNCPRLALALSWLAGQDERLLHEQITRVGSRAATERMAHLFIELYLRLLRVGVDEEAARRLPLTQVMLAETLGMSHVHANRCFRELVRAGAAEARNSHVWLLDPDFLAKRGGFDAGYLEQQEVPQRTRNVAADHDVGSNCT